MPTSLRSTHTMARRSVWLLRSVLLGSLLLAGTTFGGLGCGTPPPMNGTGGTAAGGTNDSGGGPGAGGVATGGVAPGDGGGGGAGGSSGGTPSGGAGSGGGDNTGGSGGGTGGTATTAFTCPPGSESMAPNLGGTPTALPGTLPTAPGGGSNSIMEGPVWIDGTLFLSQIRDYGPLNPAQLLKHDGSDYTLWMPDSLTNGLAVTGEGTILAASHGVGGLVEIDPTAASPSATTVIAEFMGTRLNSPNDLVIRDDGNVYFTDPNYQCDNPCDQADTRVYRYPAGGGPLEEIPTGHDNPNGITLSLDGTKLYVAGPGGIEVYTLDAGGAVAAGPNPFNDVSLSGVDGLGRDCAGNIYAAANGEVTVLDPEGAQVGSTITVPNQTTNVAFGGASGTVLYITTMSSAGVYTLDVGIPGYPY